MVGELGTATADLSPEGMVRVRDALWRARTNRATPIAAGDPIRVAGVEGLVLQVEPAGAEDRATGEAGA
jgi:membrane-bound serine protease (ClpP class)